MSKPINEILLERGKTHGDFTDNSDIAQDLKDIVRAGRYWHKRTKVEREAIETMCSKLARWVSAENFHPDNPIDISGYATLVVERVE